MNLGKNTQRQIIKQAIGNINTLAGNKSYAEAERIVMDLLRMTYSEEYILSIMKP